LNNTFVNPAIYNWSISDGTQNNNSSYFWSPKKDGQFVVKLQITDSKICSAMNDSDLTINILPKPIANFSINPSNSNIDNPVVTFNNQSQFANIYNWEFGDGFTDRNFNSTHTYQDTGNYFVILTVENQIGCIDSTAQILRINPVYKAFIPTAFSPNADGRNDFIKPVVSGVKTYDWQIFDRWGAMVFSSKNEHENWDGKLNNNPLSDGTYIYILNVLDVNGLLHKEQGSFVLMR